MTLNPDASLDAQRGQKRAVAAVKVARRVQTNLEEHKALSSGVSQLPGQTADSLQRESGTRRDSGRLLNLSEPESLSYLECCCSIAQLQGEFGGVSVLVAAGINQSAFSSVSFGSEVSGTLRLFRMTPQQRIELRTSLFYRLPVASP